MGKEFSMRSSLESLRCEIVSCRRCPRLVAFREQVPVRKMYADENYWRKPVPGFGDPHAWLLIAGLAPAAHGGNRTGRLFTGDLSSKFLIGSLYAAGLANQPTSEYIGDGLQLFGCYMTAVVKCVPPKDKPLPSEVANCNCYFRNELLLLKNVTHVLALGKFAFDVYRKTISVEGKKVNPTQFAHGQRYVSEGGPVLYASFHPSPQNTNTGKLTQKMFLDLLQAIKDDKNFGAH